MGKSSNPIKSIKKTVKSTGKAIDKAASQTKQNLEHFGDDINWTSVREGLVAAGVVGAAVATGGAALGVAGVGTIGTVAGLAAGMQGYNNAETAKDTARAEAKYQAEVEKADEEATAKRKANLLSMKKQLQPKVGRSYVMGGSGGSSDDTVGTSTKLG